MTTQPPFTCFKCGDGNTPLCCLNCANEMLSKENEQLRQKLACGGPLNAESWTLAAFLAEMEKVKAVASDKTCVSFECFCWGASSLWHQTHREAFRQVDRKPKDLGRFVLDECGSISTGDFPKQVLELLKSIKAERDAAIAALQQAQADAAAMREVLQMCKEVEGTQSTSYDPEEYNQAIVVALATDSGKAILERLEEARDAMQSLRDHQNGCPLTSYEKGWNEAMAKVDAWLNPKEGK